MGLSGHDGVPLHPGTSGPPDPTASGPADPAAQALAEASAAAMWSGDQASRGLGMRVLEVGPGRAVLAMAVREDMVNGHGICHGGLVFTLADSAFAVACNSRNHITLAQAADIVFVAPARLGETLRATATERTSFGRNGVYDVRVTREGDAAVIAEFRGRSRQVAGTLVDPDEVAG